jgi:FKBP-type peptidyl-prolyl cis-trans isomerase
MLTSRSAMFALATIAGLTGLAGLAGCNSLTAPRDEPVPATTTNEAAKPPPSPVASATPPPMPAAEPAPPDVAAAPADAAKTASGLATKVLSPGTGNEHPSPEDTVKVNYTGWNKAGKMFDSTKSHGGDPATFGVGQVIKGWTEGLQLMVKGEKRRFWIPANLAYGDTPRMGGAPSGDLVFDVELLDITKAAKPPPVPEDVKAAPASAKKTASGLAYRQLKKGTGAVSPKATDTVSVNYTGWTTDGKMFDSSTRSGAPVSFPLNGVIKGWTEGLQLMKVGEVTRFWIPANLAYGDNPQGGAPSGTLVFDVELVAIQ